MRQESSTEGSALRDSVGTGPAGDEPEEGCKGLAPRLRFGPSDPLVGRARRPHFLSVFQVLLGLARASCGYSCYILVHLTCLWAWCC